MDGADPLTVVAAAVTGLLIGSFCNVAIVRLPAGQSVVLPARSTCPACGESIPPWRNLPVVTWLAQRGRAACCGTRIGWRYPAVELAVAALWAFMAAMLAPAWLLAAALPFAAGAVCIAVIDAEHYRIPHRLSAAVALLSVAGAASVALAVADPPAGAGMRGLWVPLACGAAAALPLQLIRWSMRRAMGQADVYVAFSLGVAVAAVSGPGAVLVAMIGAICSAAVLGSAWFAVGVMAKRRTSDDRRIPFGPHLCLGGLAAFVWGADIWSWYVGLL